MIYNIYAVGDSLRNIRKKYGYTQNDMAESLGISYTHYSQIEQGRHHMSMQLMMKIVSKYGVDPNSLLGIQKERQSTDEEILILEQKLKNLKPVEREYVISICLILVEGFKCKKSKMSRSNNKYTRNV